MFYFLRISYSCCSNVRVVLKIREFILHFESVLCDEIISNLFRRILENFEIFVLHVICLFVRLFFLLFNVHLYYGCVVGDKFKQLKVGSISTPIGLLQLSVAYRTNMTISPQPSGIDTSIMVKSDHFRPDFSPKHGNRNQSR